MNHYKNLICYIDDLILDKGVKIEGLYSLSLDDLTHDERQKLCALYLEHDERNTSECFHDPKQSYITDDITAALLQLLQNNTHDNRDQLVDLICKNALVQCSPKIQAIIDLRCSCIDDDIAADEGLYRVTNKEDNSVTWRRAS